MKELFSLSAAHLIQKMQARTLGVEELVKMYIARIERYGLKNELNAICEINENAILAAKQMDNSGRANSCALYGLPVLVKDNIDVSGLHTTAGSYALKNNIAKASAPVIEGLQRNGAIILGKTNMTEFANFTSQGMPNGYSSLGGQVKNAYDKNADPSGSSTGSAVAVSAGLCAAAIGTDTSFSIVGCAAVNGVTGYKPPHGALSSEGIIPISKTLDSAGTLTHSLSDSILVYSHMRETPFTSIEPAKPETIRLAVNTYNRNTVSNSQLEKYNDVLKKLKHDGGTVTEVLHPYTPYQKDIMRFEFKHDLEAYLSNSAAGHRSLSDITAFYEENPEYMKYGISILLDALENTSGRLNDDEYIFALGEQEKTKGKMLAGLEGFDACLMTGPTNIMHFIGLPSVALRLGMDNDNMPRGMILYGANENRLLSAALTLEKYCLPVRFPVGYSL